MINESVKHTKMNMALRILLALLCSIFIFLFVYNDFAFYKEPIGKITHIDNKKNNQTVTLKLKNTKQKDKIFKIDNKFDSSGVYDEKFYTGDFVFLNSSHTKIIGVKRDYFAVGTFLLLLCALIIIGGSQGLLTVICLIGNIGLFCLLMKFYFLGKDIMWTSILASCLFAFLVLLLINGPNRRLVISFFATVIATGMVCALAMSLIWFTHIEYDFLRFLPGPSETSQANRFFLSQIIIGSLGAIIDVSVTVTAAGTEIVNRTENISLKELIASVRNVADDITGTMINIILLTNIAAMLPIFMVSLPNDIRFTTVLRYDGYFDIVRILMGIIGILISIPISIIVSSMFFKQRKTEND